MEIDLDTEQPKFSSVEVMKALVWHLSGTQVLEIAQTLYADVKPWQNPL